MSEDAKRSTASEPLLLEVPTTKLLCKRSVNLLPPPSLSALRSNASPPRRTANLSRTNQRTLMDALSTLVERKNARSLLLLPSLLLLLHLA